MLEAGASPEARRFAIAPAERPSEMTSVPAEKLDKLIQRWETIQADLSRGVNQATRVQLSKEFAELNPVVATIQALRKAEREREDLAALIDDPAADKDLAA